MTRNPPPAKPNCPPAGNLILFPPRFGRLTVISKEGKSPMDQTAATKQIGEEKDAEWYSKKFLANPQQQEHYTASKYYFLFSALLARMAPDGGESVLDVGCGGGHMGGLLHDVGVKRYCGFDFSQARVDHARAAYPGCEFHVADIFQTDLFKTCDYDIVICTEVLEHIERDRDVLSKIKSGTRFLGSVPSYPAAAHVRYFANAGEVENRYRDQFARIRVDGLPYGTKGHWIYVIDGIVM